MKGLRRIVTVLLVIATMGSLSACGSSNPCESCGSTPTWGYKNTYTGEKEYYCSDCSSTCFYCSGKATMHYTSGLGIIIFVCDDCYEDIKDFNTSIWGSN